MESSFKLGRLAGIEIGVHYTWLFAFLLVAWSLASGFFPANYPGWGLATYWVVGILAALALFASVLVHELSHSFVALARGQEVHSITLFIFGGVSNLKAESERPQDEFLISIVGPLTSFVLAAIFWAAHQLVGLGDSPLGAALGYLAIINLILGVFNLVPGFPLDGGRVLRSAIWAATGSLRRATDIASYVGQGVGFLLIFWGVARLLSGDFFGGLWTAFIGWFLNSAAETTRQQQVLSENLRGVRVAELMDPHPPTTPPDLTVTEFVTEHVLRRGQRALLVTEAGRLLGIVSITDAKELPQEAWATTPVARIMTPTPLKTIAPDADLNTALELLVDGGLNQLPVVQAGNVVGLLSRADILRFIQLRADLRLRHPPDAGARSRAA
ncbi:MAG TPA: site-2 protease family protein [Chloroflexota bacterium]|nr:site-2 protease family protein [Chloroflexota bacterium]